MKIGLKKIYNAFGYFFYYSYVVYIPLFVSFVPHWTSLDSEWVQFHLNCKLQ